MPRKSSGMTVRGRKVSDRERKAIWAKKSNKIKTKHDKRRTRTKRKKMKKVYTKKKWKRKRIPDDRSPPFSAPKYDKAGRIIPKDRRTLGGHGNRKAQRTRKKMRNAKKK